MIATNDELKKISTDIRLILRQLSQQDDWLPQVVVTLASALGALQKLTQQGEVTQQAVDDVLTAIKAAAPERQTQLMTSANVPASETFTAMALELGIRS